MDAVVAQVEKVKEEGVVQVDTAEVKVEMKEQENEFAYIDQTGFTSEIFKVELRDLPRYYGIGVST